MNAWLIATASAAIAGLAICPALTSRALVQVGGERQTRTELAFAALAGAVAGAAAVTAAHQTNSWWWTPAFLIWAFTLAAAASCDAHTQRIPTRLVRRGAIMTAALVVAAAAVTEDWQGLSVAVLACVTAGLILAICWRFAGAGFGDVRLAIVGGLGLSHTSHVALAIAVGVFAAATASQAPGSRFAATTAMPGSRTDLLSRLDS